MYLCYIILLQKLFPIYVQKVKGGKKSTSGKRSTSGKDQGEDAHGILEGISSLHSWIKTQTMIRPHPKGGRGGKQGAMYDEVIIFLQVRFSQIVKKITSNKKVKIAIFF